MKKAIVSVVVIIILAGGIAAVVHNRSKDDTATTSANSSTSINSMLTSKSMDPVFTIHANDTAADHETLSVRKGANVSLTFAVETSGTYHGGLEFVSTDPSITSGPIAAGNNRTITFTATKSFSFQPYWYESQVKKDYLINVNVTE